MSIADELQKLEELRRSGSLTKEEFSQAKAKLLAASDRTGIEVYCCKPWSGLGVSPRCTITDTDCGVSTEHQLAWEMPVFIALKPGSGYHIRIRRPSDFLSFKASFEFSLAAGEVKRLVYESPLVSFGAGTIKEREV